MRPSVGATRQGTTALILQLVLLQLRKPLLTVFCLNTCCCFVLLQIISGYLGGADSSVDLHGNTFATATALAFAPDAGGLTASGAKYGTIRGISDIDMFTFVTAVAGTVTITVTVHPDTERPCHGPVQTSPLA